MKEYLLKFRDQILSAAFLLFRRLLPSSLIATFLVSIIIILILYPILLMSYGFGPFEFVEYYQYNQEMQQQLMSNMGDFEKILEVYSNQPHQIAPSYMILTFVLAMLLMGWAVTFYLKLSDNEIRNGSPFLLKSLKESISGNIIKVVFATILLSILNIAVFVIFALVFALVSSVAQILGILIGFVGFFVVLIFILRFVLTIPAIIHGSMGITEAMGYSYKKITWKRGAQMLLIGILFIVLLSLIMVFLALIFGGSISKFTTTGWLVMQISNYIFNVLFITYFIAAMSSLYFRYSNDEIDDNLEHLVEENNQE